VGNEKLHAPLEMRQVHTAKSGTHRAPLETIRERTGAELNATPTSDKPRNRAAVFSALITDRRISHGAFRLWHCLRDHQNAVTNDCFPGQRRIVGKICCDVHSLKKWTTELIRAKWLFIKPHKRGEVFHYELLDGNGQLLRKTPSPKTAAENHNTGVVEKRMGKTTTKLIPCLKQGIKNKKTDSPLSLGDSALDAQSPASGVHSWE